MCNLHERERESERETDREIDPGLRQGRFAGTRIQSCYNNTLPVHDTKHWAIMAKGKGDGGGGVGDGNVNFSCLE